MFTLKVMVFGVAEESEMVTEVTPGDVPIIVKVLPDIIAMATDESGPVCIL